MGRTISWTPGSLEPGDTFPCVIIIWGPKAPSRLFELPLFLVGDANLFQIVNKRLPLLNLHWFSSSSDVIRINRDKLGSWVHGLTIGVFAPLLIPENQIHFAHHHCSSPPRHIMLNILIIKIVTVFIEFYSCCHCLSPWRRPSYIHFWRLTLD